MNLDTNIISILLTESMTKEFNMNRGFEIRKFIISFLIIVLGGVLVV